FSATIYLARTLGAASYGVIGVAIAVMLYLSRIVDAGMEIGTGTREVAAQPARIGAIAGTMLLVRLIIAVVVLVALTIVGRAVLPQPDGTVIPLYGLTLLAFAVNSRWIHLGLRQTRPMAVARVAGELTMVALVVFTVHGASDVFRVPLAQFAGDLLAAGLLMWWLS